MKRTNSSSASGTSKGIKDFRDFPKPSLANSKIYTDARSFFQFKKRSIAFMQTILINIRSPNLLLQKHIIHTRGSKN